jgi:RES domain-containing protein
VRLYRISNHTRLDGDGGLRASGRWHTKGRPLVYCAPDPAVAVLEILVHLEVDAEDFPSGYQLLTIDVPESISTTTLESNALPENWWRDSPTTRAIGDNWLVTVKTALLAVPCAIVPETTNYLLNPVHPDSPRIRITRIATYRLDERLRR